MIKLCSKIGGWGHLSDCTDQVLVTIQWAVLPPGPSTSTPLPLYFQCGTYDCVRNMYRVSLSPSPLVRERKAWCVRESASLTVSIHELGRGSRFYYWCVRLRARTTERVVAQTKKGPEKWSWSSGARLKKAYYFSLHFTSKLYRHLVLF